MSNLVENRLLHCCILIANERNMAFFDAHNYVVAMEFIVLLESASLSHTLNNRIHSDELVVHLEVAS